MTIGFAPEPTLPEYIAKVQRLLPQYLLTPGDRDWASLSRRGGIKASRFAGWLALSASSPLSPASPAEKTNPLPVREPEGGRNL